MIVFVDKFVHCIFPNFHFFFLQTQSWYQQHIEIFLWLCFCPIVFVKLISRKKVLNRTHTCPLHNQLRGNDVNWPEIKAIWKATVHGQAARILKKKICFSSSIRENSLLLKITWFLQRIDPYFIDDVKKTYNHQNKLKKGFITVYSEWYFL